MKRVHIPLSVGIAGLLLAQLACNDSPTGPERIGAPDSHAAARYIDVQVSNESTHTVYVSLELEGYGVEPLGVVRAGTQADFAVTSEALGGAAHPVRVVAISVQGADRSLSEPVQVMAGWCIEIAITSVGTSARAFPREY